MGRNQPTYNCRCKSNSTFKTYSSFETHIKNGTHKNYIQYYKNNNNLIDKLNRELNEYKKENELLKLKNDRVTKELLKVSKELLNEKTKNITLEMQQI